MAVTCSFSSHILYKKSSPIVKPLGMVLMLKHCRIPIKKTSILQIRSSLQNKVFEDPSRGIICYTDDSGEIICEGYDEGPRHQQVQITTYYPREVEIIDLLEQRWLQIVNSSVQNHADKGVAVQEDFNWNDFNKLC